MRAMPQMSRWHRLLLAGLLLAGATASAAEPADAGQRSATTVPPQRIVSLSLCVDDLLLDLVPDARIAAVSQLATDPRYSRHAERARNLHRHDGLAEQIVALQPDLVLAAEYEQGKLSQWLQQFGYPVQIITTPTRLAEVPTEVRRVARLLGTEAKAEQLLTQWQQRLLQYQYRADAGLANPGLTTESPLAISLAPNAYSPGQHSIKNELLRWTGYRSVADALGLPFDQELSLEQIVLLAPAYVFLEERQGNRAALAYQLLKHPALQADAKRRHIGINSANWLCAGFGLADAAAELAQARQ